MTDLVRYNPFTERNVIQNPDEFFGRKDELRAIITRLQGLQSTSIYGERKIGKSSLLYYVHYNIPRELGNEYKSAYINIKYSDNHTAYYLLRTILSKFKCDPEVILENGSYIDNLVAFSESIKELRETYKPVLLIDDFDHIIREPEEFNRYFLETLRTLGCRGYIAYVTASFYSIKQINILVEFSESSKELKKTCNPVILIDNFDHIIRNPVDLNRDFLETLETLGYKGYVAHFTASFYSLNELSNKIELNSPFYGIFSEMKLGEFSSDETTEFLSTRREGINFNAEEIRLIKEVAGNNPLDIRIACYHIYASRGHKWDRNELETRIKNEITFYNDKAVPFVIIPMRKGMLILDKNLEELLKEIQKKAKIACKELKGTVLEDIACDFSRKVQGWKGGTEEEIALDAEKLLIYMKSKVPRLLGSECIFEKITEIENKKDINILLKSIPNLFDELPKIMIDPERMKPTIGIITALPKEYAAVNILLENKKDKYKIPGSGAGRRYCLGEISSEDGNKHNLVLATAGMGNNIAATRASLLLEHFPNVKSIIMVGIAGGVPNPYKDKVDDHVRLGDIVVSNESGVIQYDLIKQEIQDITHRNPPRPPSASLLEAVRYLEAEEILGNRPWERYIVQSLSQLKIGRPSDDKDILYNSANQDETIPHPEDPKRIKGQPRVFTGPIASANILQKEPNARDKLREKFKVKAIEMEASGIADATWNHEVGYLVVRGICDYCDSHKNDDWQQYAAVVAAAYTRALVESMP